MRIGYVAVGHDAPLIFIKLSDFSHLEWFKSSFTALSQGESDEVKLEALPFVRLYAFSAFSLELAEPGRGVVISKVAADRFECVISKSRSEWASSLDLIAVFREEPPGGWQYLEEQDGAITVEFIFRGGHDYGEGDLPLM